jgi:hypothetical protein
MTDTCHPDAKASRPRPTLTVDAARALFKYDKATGYLYWRVPGQRRRAGTRAGSRRPDGYYNVSISGRHYLVHRIIWLWVTGAWPPMNIDHADLNKSNNAWSNLRLATPRQNSANRRAAVTNKSGFKGVCKGSPNRWQAAIRINGRIVHLGSFKSPELAHAAYKRAADEFHGIYARA